MIGTVMATSLRKISELLCGLLVCIPLRLSSRTWSLSSMLPKVAGLGLSISSTFTWNTNSYKIQNNRKIRLFWGLTPLNYLKKNLRDCSPNDITGQPSTTWNSSQMRRIQINRNAFESGERAHWITFLSASLSKSSCDLSLIVRCAKYAMISLK